MAVNAGGDNESSESSKPPMPSRINSSDDSNNDHEKSTSRSNDTLESSSSTSLVFADLDLIESADKTHKNQLVTNRKNSRSAIRTDDNVIEKTSQDMNTIKELGQRIKGYNGSRLHRIMSKDFATSTEGTTRQDKNTENDSNSKTTSVLFDDAWGIRNVDMEVNHSIDTKPYLQIEQFHRKSMKPFVETSETQRNNVIAKEPLKANVYKVFGL